MLDLTFEPGHWALLCGALGYVVAYVSLARPHSRFMPLGLLAAPFLPGSLLVNAVAALFAHASLVSLHLWWFQRKQGEEETAAGQRLQQHKLASMLTSVLYIFVVLLSTIRTGTELQRFDTDASIENMRNNGFSEEIIDQVVLIDRACRERSKDSSYMFFLRMFGSSTPPQQGFDDCLEERLQRIATTDQERADTIVRARAARALTKPQLVQFAEIMNQGPFTAAVVSR